MTDSLSSIETSVIITTCIWLKLTAIAFCGLSILFKHENLMDFNFTKSLDNQNTF